ncbi:MAG TPA: hypothetical protein DD727_08330, partial [Clostridiales bacterium]|nr:hypothetical protein [Clostridiales bacterium]
MLAIRKLKEGAGNLSLCEIDTPVLGSSEVLIKVHAAGICGTDIKIMHGLTWSNPPVTLGHELSGEIIKVAPDVTGLKPGDRVTSETAQIICGECYFCKTGDTLMCAKRLSIGYGTDGAMANYIKVRKDIVHLLPDGMTL